MSKKNLKILIAEDEKPMAKALQLKLNGAGFETQIATDGEAVLDLIGKEKSPLGTKAPKNYTALKKKRP